MGSIEDNVKDIYALKKTIVDNYYGETGEEARHMNELRTRIMACSREELIVICDAIAKEWPDILFDSLLKEMLHKEGIINKMRGDLNE